MNNIKLGTGEIIIIIYIILILSVNVGCSIWGNIQSKIYINNAKESQMYNDIKKGEKIISQVLPSETSDGLLKIMNLGKSSLLNFGPFIFSIFASLFSSIMLLLPNFFIQQIKEAFYKHNIEIFEVKNLTLFLFLSFSANLIVCYFDISSQVSLWNLMP
jgi:hypothetical protein